MELCIYCSSALHNKSEIDEGIAIISEALKIADQHVIA